VQSQRDFEKPLQRNTICRLAAPYVMLLAFKAQVEVTSLFAHPTNSAGNDKPAFGECLLSQAVGFIRTV